MIKKRYVMILSLAIVSVLLGSLLYNNLVLAKKPEPTIREMRIVHSYYEWSLRGVLYPHEYYEFENDTAGYKEVNLKFSANNACRVYVGYVFADGDRWSVYADETTSIFETYSVRTSRIYVLIDNPSDTRTVNFALSVYVTT